MTQVTLLTSPERRGRWSPAERETILAAAFAPGSVVADVARQFEVSTSLTAGSGLAWIWQESSTGLRGSSFESRHARDLKLRNSAVAGASGWLGHLRRQTLYLQRRRSAWVMQFIIHCEVATSDKSRWGFA